MKNYGELTNPTDHRQNIKSPVIRIGEELTIQLVYNDVPVTVHYKQQGNYPWKSLLINDSFRSEAIPRFSDIYLMCSINRHEIVKYSITY